MRVRRWVLGVAGMVLSGCCFNAAGELATSSTGTGSATSGASTSGSTGSSSTSGSCAGRSGAAPAGPSGPGNACVRDADCPGCGWVCSATLGVCIQSMTGDPGSCAVDSDCACACQQCAGGHCTPTAKTACACNSDCPSGEICDQLTFQCHAQPTVGLSCGGYHASGTCGCGFICGGGSENPSCQPVSPVPECEFFDCNTCETGAVCVRVGDAGGGFPGCYPIFDGGWCH